tara:strand:- start:306 stop:737 length:432 start_codon:yes stop_codon:yes gene_type:complete
MTKDKLSETAALRALSSETPDAQALAEMLGFVAVRLPLMVCKQTTAGQRMALDVDQLCRAGAHQRSTDWVRANPRNGYRARAWETRAGTVDVKIPKLRKATYIKVRRSGRIVSVAAIVAVAPSRQIAGSVQSLSHVPSSDGGA